MSNRKPNLPYSGRERASAVAAINVRFEASDAASAANKMPHRSRYAAMLATTRSGN